MDIGLKHVKRGCVKMKVLKQPLYDVNFDFALYGRGVC